MMIPQMSKSYRVDKQTNRHTDTHTQTDTTENNTIFTMLSLPVLRTSDDKQVCIRQTDRHMEVND